MKFVYTFFIAISICIPLAAQTPQSFDKIFPSHSSDALYTIMEWSEDTLFAGGANSTLLISVDRGASWDPIQLSGLGVSDACEFIAIHSFSRKNDDLYFTAMPSMHADSPYVSLSVPEYSQILLFRYRPMTGSVANLSFPRSITNYSSSFYPVVQCTDDFVFVVEDGSYYDSSKIHRSTDGGYQWTSFALPNRLVAFNTLPNNDLLCVTYPSSTYRGHPTISRDDGQTWVTDTTIEIDKNYGNIASEVLEDGTILCAIGGYTKIYYSTDTCSTWQTINEIRINDIYLSAQAIDINSQGDFYICTPTASIYRSTNTGSSWIPLYPENVMYGNYYFSPVAISATNNGAITVCTDYGSLIHSGNSGSSWIEVYESAFKFIRAMHFFDHSNGFIVAALKDNSNALFITSNSGTNWHQKPVSDDFDMSDIIFDISTYDALYAYSLERTSGAYTFTLFVSQDQGDTWQTIHASNIPSSHFPGNFRAVEGLMLAYSSLNDTLYCSTDNGASWNVRQFPTELTGTPSHRSIEVVHELNGENTVYGYLNASAIQQGLYRSIDNCTSWDKKFGFTTDTVQTITETHFLGRDTVFIETRTLDYSYRLYCTFNAYDSWEIYYNIPSEIGRGTSLFFYPDIYTYQFGAECYLTYSNDLYQNYSTIFHTACIPSGKAFFLDKSTCWIASGRNLHFMDGSTTSVNPLPEVPSEPLASSVYPNPVRRGTSATILLSNVGSEYSAMNCELSIYDALGRNVASNAHGVLMQSSDMATWHIPATLPPGVYTVRISGSNTEAYTKISVIE